METRFRTFIVGLIGLLTALIDGDETDAAVATEREEVLVERVEADEDERTITVRARYREDGRVFQRNATVDVDSIADRLYRGRASRFGADVTVIPCDGSEEADFDGNVIALHPLDEVLNAIHRANGLVE